MSGNRFLMVLFVVLFAISIICIGCSTGGSEPEDSQPDGSSSSSSSSGGSSSGGSTPSHPPTVQTFEATSNSIISGQSVTLSWQVENATQITISPGIGVVSGDSVEVNPLITTTYTITAINTIGEDTQSLTINVTPVPQAGKPVTRGDKYQDFDERFNRYYTDSTYTPDSASTIYVSPDGNGDGTSRNSPMSVPDAFDAVTAGIMVYFLRGQYDGCFELAGYDGASGTYDDPVVLYAERNEDGSRGVLINCCDTGRATCINLEGADYVAVDGFEFNGGSYGVRAVGLGYSAGEHQQGIAVLNCEGHDQYKDPFFTGQSDWAVFENNLGHDAGSGDGHGLYISNGSDWNIVRNNELHSNLSSDFQINADPQSTCVEDGIAVDDPRCDALAGYDEQGQPNGGQGVSDYMLVEDNFFHHGLAQGANFTSVRNSIVQNNIFALYARHGVSFWQETDNPELGSSGNIVHHNMFITQNHRQVLQFIRYSTRNHVANNFFLGATVSGGSVIANTDAVWMEVDDTVSENIYDGNVYLFGSLNGRSLGDNETIVTADHFNSAWFPDFPTTLPCSAEDFRPSVQADFLLNKGTLLSETLADRNGTPRMAPVDIGPFEID